MKHPIFKSTALPGSGLRNFNGFLVLSDPPENQNQCFELTVEQFKDIEDAMDREYIERLRNQDGDTPSGDNTPA